MRLIYAALVFLAACSPGHKNPPKDPSEPATLDELRAKASTYEMLLRQDAMQHDGWISRGCDALLFSGIFAAGLEDPSFAKIELAELSPGQWTRRPVDMGLCYPDHSKSTISKDMLIGLAWWAWRAKRGDVMTRLTSYGLEHGWVMGEPSDRPGEVVATPELAAIFYQIIYELGGDDHPTRKIPDIYPSGLTGFEAHLQVESILLHGEIDDTKGVSDAALKRLREHAARQPNNPLFAVAMAIYTGDTTAARSLLSNESQWPVDRLPDGGSHCEPWVVQRDDGADWHACAGGKVVEPTLYGADFVWMVSLLTRPR